MSDDPTREMLPDHDTAGAPARAAPAAAGFDIGPEIARGGMGVIHRGRDVALDREVAIKVLQDHFSIDGSSAKRFVAEARITGQLQHPGIPPIHHVGTLADGRPFLAMKLIKGETLADAKTVGDKLAVFEAVCQAVGYAHAHGVIHRDLKPANVMVGTYGEVQVMDWGLAKVLADRPPPADDPDATRGGTEIRSLRDDGDHTHAGNVLGTPAFMPPEQAIGANEQVDARSDVFGLGGILCVLLTGRPPYVGESSESTRQLAARAKLHDALAALDKSGAEPDLIALCKRCLSPEPADRPADAGAVATEVAALRLAAIERAKRAEIATAEAEVKAAEERKRRRVWLRAVGAVAAVFAAAAGLSTWLAVRAYWAEQSASQQLLQTKAAEEKARDEEGKAREAEALAKAAETKAKGAEATAKDREAKERAARADADKQKRQAKEEAASALAVKDFVCDILATADPKKNATPAEVEAHRRDTRKNLDYAVKRLDDFDGKAATEAEIRNTIGLMYDKVGAPAEAEDQLKQSLALYEKGLGPEAVTTLHAVNALAGFYAGRGRPADAEPLFLRSLAGFEKDTGIGALLAMQSCRQLVAVATARAKPPAVVEYFRRWVTVSERYYGPNSFHAMNLRWQLGRACDQAGQYAAAEREYRAVIGRADRAGTDDPVAAAAFAIADGLGIDDPVVRLASSSLEECLAAQGKYAEAEAEIRSEIERVTKTYAPPHQRYLDARFRLGFFLADRGEFERSNAVLEELLKALAEAGRPEDAEACRVLTRLGNNHRRLGRAAEAVALLESAERIRRRHRTLDRYRDLLLTSLVDGYAATGRAEKIAALCRDRAAEVRAVEKPDTAARADGLAYIGWYMLTVRQFTEAEPVLRECLTTYEKLNPDAWQTHNAAWMLGWAMVGRGQAAAAEPLLLRGYAGLKRQAATIPENFREVVVAAADRLVAVYERLDRPADAAKWRAERATYPREAAPPPRAK